MPGVILYVRIFATLPGLSIGWLFDKPPIRHLGFAAGLAVDSPARPVIVRSTSFGALIDVAEYAEIKVGILVKNCAFRIHVRAEVIPEWNALSWRQCAKFREIGGRVIMAYTLDQFATDCRAALLKDAGRAGREHVRQLTEKACADIRCLAPRPGRGCGTHNSLRGSRPSFLHTR